MEVLANGDVCEQRRVQNRNSQRAFRKRQASYISALESELKELRAKYDSLLKTFNQIKEAVDITEWEVCEESVEHKDETMLESTEEMFTIPNWSV